VCTRKRNKGKGILFRQLLRERIDQLVGENPRNYETHLYEEVFLWEKGNPNGVRKEEEKPPRKKKGGEEPSPGREGGGKRKIAKKKKTSHLKEGGEQPYEKKGEIFFGGGRRNVRTR